MIYFHSYSLTIGHCHCLLLDERVRRNGNARNFWVSYSSSRAFFTDQNWIPKILYCIRCVMVCKIGFTNWNAKIALLRVSLVVTYLVVIFWMGADRHNGILMSLLLLVAGTIKLYAKYRFFTMPIYWGSTCNICWFGVSHFCWYIFVHNIYNFITHNFWIITYDF